MGPLSGVKVVELGGLIAGPLTARLLADYGAEVVKIEVPGKGDELRTWGAPSPKPWSYWFMSQARNKRLVAIDLKTPKGMKLGLDLFKRADMVVENLRPGKLEQLGLGPQTLWAEHPALIYVRLSGFGQTGPYRSRGGFGSIAESMGGLRYVTGYEDRPPLRTGFSLGDSLAALHAVSGALAALHHQRHTGRGQVVDVSITESVLNATDGLIPDYIGDGRIRERTGNRMLNAAPSSIYPTREGGWIAIGGNADRLFPLLMQAIGRPDLAKDPELQSNRGRLARADELDEAISAWTKTQALHNIQRTLDDLGIPARSIRPRGSPRIPTLRRET